MVYMALAPRYSTKQPTYMVMLNVKPSILDDVFFNPHLITNVATSRHVESPPSLSLDHGATGSSWTLVPGFGGLPDAGQKYGTVQLLGDASVLV